MPGQLVKLTPQESALCTVLSNLMNKGRMSSQRIGRVFSVSEHTVRSLVCARRRPGPWVLERLEEGCVQLLLESKTPKARQVWWRLLDATVRCGIFPMHDPEARLRESLKRDIESVAAPDDFYDLPFQLWESFEAGASPSWKLLDQVVRLYRREAERLIEEEGEWEEALACRGIALIAERIQESMRGETDPCISSPERNLPQ